MIPTVYLELYSSSVCCGGVLIHLGYLCKNKNFFRPSQFIPFQGNLKAIKLTMAPGTQRTPMAPVTPMTPMTPMAPVTPMTPMAPVTPMTPMTPMTLPENTIRTKEQKNHEHRRRRKMKGGLKVREVEMFRLTDDWV